MPYSLVSAATLGFDLVRLPAGRAVADVLLAGLAADVPALEQLAAVHPAAGADREQRAALAVRSRKARELAAAVPHLRTAADALPGADRAAVLVAQLERSTIGDAAAVERVLREDVVADRDQPPFDRVAMDGVGVVHEAVRGGTTRFRVASVQRAGEPPRSSSSTWRPACSSSPASRSATTRCSSPLPTATT